VKKISGTDFGAGVSLKISRNVYATLGIRLKWKYLKFVFTEVSFGKIWLAAIVSLLMDIPTWRVTSATVEN
jgi:hypothetical protein